MKVRDTKFALYLSRKQERLEMTRREEFIAAWNAASPILIRTATRAACVECIRAHLSLPWPVEEVDAVCAELNVVLYHDGSDGDGDSIGWWAFPADMEDMAPSGAVCAIV